MAVVIPVEQRIADLGGREVLPGEFLVVCAGTDHVAVVRLVPKADALPHLMRATTIAAPSVEPLAVAASALSAAKPRRRRLRLLAPEG